MTSTNRPAPDESGFPPKMGAPARRALENAGYTQLDQLAGLSKAQLLKLHGMGPKAMGMLRDALAAKGLALSA